MASAAQIAANRLNAQKSTGPRTPEGKAASARNALKHGLCARKLVIDEEEGPEFEALRADYFARFQPQGLAEARLVDRMAQIAWRRERGSTMEAAAWRGYARGGWLIDPKGIGKQRWHEDGDPTVAARATPIMNGVTAELLRITMYEARLSRELARLSAELEKLQHRRRYSSYREEAQPAAPPPPAPAEDASAPEAESDATVKAPPAEPAAAQNSAKIGFVSSPEPAASPSAPPAPDASSLDELEAWARREKARLDAEARAVAAALKNQAPRPSGGGRASFPEAAPRRLSSA